METSDSDSNKFLEDVLQEEKAVLVSLSRLDPDSFHIVSSPPGMTYI